METESAVNKPLFYIEYYQKNSEKLVDISEEGYATLDLCHAVIENFKAQDLDIQKELLQKYEDELKNFVLDLDTSDQMPSNPLTYLIHYDMRAKLYIKDEKGFHEVTEHVIKNLNNLQATPEQIETINYILNRTVDPGKFQSVKNWVSQCHNVPAYNELQMCAINEILEGYGIESVRTSKWKNGYWCDILCTYVNMGDSYIPTLINHRKHGFMVASIGDIIEKNKHVI